MPSSKADFEHGLNDEVKNNKLRVITKEDYAKRRDKFWNIIIKIIAFGVPALLIVLGFFAYIDGFTAIIRTNPVEMKNFGFALIVAGIASYAIELIALIYYQFQS